MTCPCFSLERQRKSRGRRNLLVHGAATAGQPLGEEGDGQEASLSPCSRNCGRPGEGAVWLPRGGVRKGCEGAAINSTAARGRLFVELSAGKPPTCCRFYWFPWL